MFVISKLSFLFHPVINIHERSADDDDDDIDRGRIFDDLLFSWSAYRKFSKKTKCFILFVTCLSFIWKNREILQNYILC